MSLPLSHSIPVGNVSRKGKIVSIVAIDVEREGIAKECGLIGLARLEAEFTVTKGAGRLLAVQGHISAEVTQSCGVTLKPVQEQVEADVALTYSLDARVAAELEVEVHPDDEDPPEPVIDGEIDFGAVALEHFALNLNPYPRASDAAFEASAWQDEPAEDNQNGKVNPFAALAGLKPPVNDP